MFTCTEEHCQESRCECGQLVAKLRPDGVELKCKRCKRIVLIPYSAVVTPPNQQVDTMIPGTT